MKLAFLGGAGTVTGSKTHDAAVLPHAHLDHAGAHAEAPGELASAKDYLSTHPVIALAARCCPGPHSQED